MIVAASRGGAGESPGGGLLIARTITSGSVAAGTETKLWICTSCGFVYDPDAGDPDGGIPPGTPFAEIPESWFCPVCGARKADFEPYEE
jgi:rubredoxin